MKRYFSILFIIVVMASFIACEEDGITDRSVEVTDGAMLCFYNLSASSSEMNLYFDDVRVSSVRSQDSAVLRGIPFRSTYPGIVTAAVVSTTMPTSYIGMEYFTEPAGSYTITVKDTAYLSGYTTFYTGNGSFENGKYYSLFAVNDISAMELVIAEDAISVYTDTSHAKLRIVNAVSGVSGDAIDVWMWHQPATDVAAIPPYKLASALPFKEVTAFTDTVSAGNYKWIITAAGAVPTENTAPAEATGKPYILSFDASDVIYSRASTSVARGTTYSMLIFGNSGSSGINAPYSSLFRNRYK